MEDRLAWMEAQERSVARVEAKLNLLLLMEAQRIADDVRDLRPAARGPLLRDKTEGLLDTLAPFRGSSASDIAITEALDELFEYVTKCLQKPR